MPKTLKNIPMPKYLAEQPPLMVNIPLQVMDRLEDHPVAGAPRAVYLEQFEDGSGFVYDPEEPRGVTYLGTHAFAVYRALLGESHRPPHVDPFNGRLYSDFVKCGIARSISAPSAGNMKRTYHRQFSVWFHISNACNLACRYCYIPQLEKAADVETMSEHFMTPNTIEASAEGLLKFCVEKGFTSLQIKFAGGEPTLNVDLVENACKAATLLAETYGIQLSFAMLSNGVFLDQRILDTLVRWKISISISIDGNRDSHDDTRFVILRNAHAEGTARVSRIGTWEKIFANIDQLLLLGVTPFILCTVTDQNYRSLKELFTQTVSRNIGVRLSLVRDLRTHQRQGVQDDILAELESLYAWLSTEMPLHMSIERHAQFAEWRPASKKTTVCSSCVSSAAIDQNGNVSSCQMRLDKPAGNLHQEPFSVVFDRLQARDDNIYLVQPRAKSSDCSVCYWKHVCAGGCPEHTRAVSGTLNAPSPWCFVYRGFLPHYLRAIAAQRKRFMERQGDEME